MSGQFFSSLPKPNPNPKPNPKPNPNPNPNPKPRQGNMFAEVMIAFCTSCGNDGFGDSLKRLHGSYLELHHRPRRVHDSGMNTPVAICLREINIILTDSSTSTITRWERESRGHRMIHGVTFFYSTMTTRSAFLAKRYIFYAIRRARPVHENVWNGDQIDRRLSLTRLNHDNVDTP